MKKDKYTWDLSLIIKDEEDFNNRLNKAYELIDELVLFKGNILSNSDSKHEHLVVVRKWHEREGINNAYLTS